MDKNRIENRIEKRIELKASISRVWKALTDYKEFGQWFGVTFESAFVEGKTVPGKGTHPGFEDLQWAINIKRLVPGRLFSFTWHPYAVGASVDYSQETPTSVEFTLEAISTGTLLVVTESGFNKLPEDRRLEAFRMHEEGWPQQLENVANYVR